MNPTKRIATILTVIFLIPALFFSVYEISSLNKDEEMIEGIYQKQLEAILFSVNQYSDDAVSRWIAKLELSYGNKDENGLSSPILQNLLTLNSSIHLAFIVDSVNQKPVTRLFSLDSLLKETLRYSVDTSLQRSSKQIQQLIKYKRSGFQKIEVVKNRENGTVNFQMLLFIIEDLDHLNVAGLFIDPETFIDDMIGPRLQVIAKDQFVLSVFDKRISNYIYSTQTSDTTSLNNLSITKDLWIFPDYSLGIRTKGASLKEIVRKRTYTNLMLLIGLDIVLIVALLFAFRSLKREVQLAQNKSDFVSNVSHEIRTPLALISMFAETLEMGRVKSEEKKQEYYSIIRKETHRLSGIVNKILNFSQTEAGKKTLHIESLNLNHEISEILKTYDFHMRNKGFEYFVDGNSEVSIKADKEALTEIVINLIDNAMKYSPEKKRIEIGITLKDGFGMVAVKDYGLGISKADQKHIFDKFYRVSSGNLAKSQGTGLGLSLVKQLIEKQKGKISVSSEPGHGSIFTLIFPLSD